MPHQLQADIDNMREAIRLHWERLDALPLGSPERTEARKAIDKLVTDLAQMLQEHDAKSPPSMFTGT